MTNRSITPTSSHNLADLLTPAPACHRRGKTIGAEDLARAARLRAYLAWGMNTDDIERTESYLAKRSADTRKERMALAAYWAIEHGGPTAFDSKGWPLDDADWPLAPRPGSMPETQRDYSVAIRVAKTRRTKRRRAGGHTTTVKGRAGTKFAADQLCALPAASVSRIGEDGQFRSTCAAGNSRILFPQTATVTATLWRES